MMRDEILSPSGAEEKNGILFYTNKKKMFHNYQEEKEKDIY